MEREISNLRFELERLHRAWGDISRAWFVLRLIVYSLGSAALVMAALAIVLAMGPGK